MTASATSAADPHLSPAKISSPSGAQQAETPGRLNRQPVLFIGGSKNGQTLTVPFEDGGVCIWIEMQPQVLLSRHLEGSEALTLPIHLEPYDQSIVDDRRNVAVSRDLQLSRYFEEFELREDQLSGAAVHQLRAAIRTKVTKVGGLILTPPIGQEEISIKLLASGHKSQSNRPLRTLRGECWLVKPANSLRADPIGPTERTIC